MVGFEFKISFGLKFNPIQVVMQNSLNNEIKMKREYI